ncbi:MAG TPA: 6-phosphogluconolactonase [Acidobacteriaceae bacterium]|nr:6-phosphogluconolactonase [Acidobacteriaceae bacterium]
MSSTLQVTYLIESDPAALAMRAALHLTELVEEAVAARGRARVAVSGGSTPKATFGLLADPQHPFLARMPWGNLELFFVDERTVPPENSESNYHMTREALLSKVNMKPEQIHRMQGELEPEVAAAEYEFDLRRTFRLEGAEVPRFDVVTLGMGDDGHTASLFPHTEAIHELGRLVVANQVPQKETWRITLTWPVINNAREVFFLIAGKDKADRLKEVFLGPKDVETLPSQLIWPASGILTLLLDKAAAAELPPPGPDGKGHLEKTR